jgi:hypothetical protein
MEINSIKFISDEEIKAMAPVNMEVTRQEITKTGSEVHREVFSAVMLFSRLAKFKLNITNDDFALLHYFSQKNYISDQFVVKAHARVVETKWPARDTQKAHSSYLLDIYLTKDLKWEFNITKSKFLPVFLEGVKLGDLAAFAPIARIPGNKEEEAGNDSTESASATLDKEPVKEKLPF